MPWVKARFNGAEVWAAVDDDGRPASSGGRRAIRYSDSAGAKVYRASALAVSGFGPVTHLPEGVSADARASAPVARGFGSAGTRTAAQSAAAASDAKARIAALSPDTVVCFTDGACTGNPGPAGSGAVVRLPDGRRIERHRALGLATNNVGELTAVGLALEILAEEGVPHDAPVVLYTDSQYALGVLTKGWKPKANIELIARLKGELRPWRDLRIDWVAGHVGVAENERADALARMGVAESSARR